MSAHHIPTPKPALTEQSPSHWHGIPSPQSLVPAKFPSPSSPSIPTAPNPRPCCSHVLGIVNGQVTNGLMTKAGPQQHSSMCQAISCLHVFVHVISLTQKALPRLPHKNPTQGSKIHTEAILSIPRAESPFPVGTPSAHGNTALAPLHTLARGRLWGVMYILPSPTPLIPAQLRDPGGSDSLLHL